MSGGDGDGDGDDSGGPMEQQQQLEAAAIHQTFSFSLSAVKAPTALRPTSYFVLHAMFGTKEFTECLSSS